MKFVLPGLFTLWTIQVVGSLALHMPVSPLDFWIVAIGWAMIAGYVVITLAVESMEHKAKQKKPPTHRA